mmetsp:Transcript_105011/g.306831  ORF Transcript_105011/g.306831 Transcript_105011/m.306831 type:complete len:248 (+) Transcript_105011:68-811(+)
MGTSAEIRFQVRRKIPRADRLAAVAKSSHDDKHTGDGNHEAQAARQPAKSTEAERAKEVECSEQVTEYGGIHLHADGYPSGAMVTLVKDLFAGCKMVNGIQSHMVAGTHANGPECLFAQAIAMAKGSSIGNVYLLPQQRPGTKRGWGPDFSYVVEVCEGRGPAGEAANEILIHVSDNHEERTSSDDGNGAVPKQTAFTPQEYLAQHGGPDSSEEQLAMCKKLRLRQRAAELLIALDLHEEARRVMGF